MLKRKMPRRNSSAALLYSVVSVLLIIVLMAFGISVFTQANIIEVEGAVQYSQGEIIEASGFDLGDNLLFLDTEAAEVRIQTLLPFIRTVEIRTVFPDRISINVSESAPIATVRYRNGILVLDSEARVVEIHSSENQVADGLIEIRGFTPLGADLGSILRVELANESQLQFLIDMFQAIEDEGYRGYVTYIDISNIANITFDYTEFYRIILDSPSNIAQNLRILRNTIEQRIDDGSIPQGVRGTIRVNDARGIITFDEDR